MPARRATCPTPGELPYPQQFIAGAVAALVQHSNGKPWIGEFLTSTGDPVE